MLIIKLPSTMLKIRWAQVGPTISRIATCRIRRLQTVFWTALTYDSLRAAHKILLFFIVFLGVFFFYLFYLKTPAWKAPTRRLLFYHRTHRGSQASHRGHHPAGMASKTNHVQHTIKSNAVTTLLLCLIYTAHIQLESPHHMYKIICTTT